MPIRFLVLYSLLITGQATNLTLPCVADEAAKDEALIARVFPSVVTIKVIGRDGDQIGIGTGFVIDENGLIATNFHVIGEGRRFTVEVPSHEAQNPEQKNPRQRNPRQRNRSLPVLAIEASDRMSDLAIVRVDVGDEPLQPLPLADSDLPPQGTRVLAFGNPLGLENSVVDGMVSAVRDVDGRELIQLAIPIEPGNSGGPLVTTEGQVVGIVNMKSSIDDNLGFAIPISNLFPLRENSNPVAINRWVRLGRVREQDWTPLFGASWQQRGGRITASGMGKSFGGRSLCLSTAPMPELPFEIAVEVRLDDESGAAGITFHSDGNHKHYGFYPSAGRMRLTCFKGPSVYSWQILKDVETSHYLPDQWNEIRVRIEKDRLTCFVNEQLVVESTDVQLTKGRFGLVKFRHTKPDFKGFRFGTDLSSKPISSEAKEMLAGLFGETTKPFIVGPDQLELLGNSSNAVSRQLERRARTLEQQVKQLRKIASDVALVPTLSKLRFLMADESRTDDQLLLGCLLIAKLDDSDVDVAAYRQRVDTMADEIRETFDKAVGDVEKRNALHRYLFQENGFRGGRAEYYHVANSHLNRVIDDREGLPITLSILYMELGKRLGLEIDGVGLPGHFVVKHVTEDTEQLVDVFERGELLSEVDAKAIVATYARRAITEEDVRAQSTIEILSRVLNNLIGGASGKQDIEAINRYCEALVAVDPTSAESRILRSRIRTMTGRHAAAVTDLDWLMKRAPPGFDRDRAQQLRAALIEKQE